MQACRKILLAALLLGASAAWADVNRQEAAEIAQRVTQGRVLAVERGDAGGRAVWRVKVLTRSGNIRVVLVDVASGRPG